MRRGAELVVAPAQELPSLSDAGGTGVRGFGLEAPFPMDEGNDGHELVPALPIVLLAGSALFFASRFLIIPFLARVVLAEMPAHGGSAPGNQVCFSGLLWL